MQRRRERSREGLPLCHLEWTMTILSSPPDGRDVAIIHAILLSSPPQQTTPPAGGTSPFAPLTFVRFALLIQYSTGVVLSMHLLFVAC